MTNPQKFSMRIDTLKELYNKLGDQITKSKQQLETSLKLSKEIQKNHDVLNDWLNAIENEGKMDFEAEIQENKEAKDKLNESYIEFQKYCDPVYLENVRERINLTNLRWDKIIGKCCTFFDVNIYYLFFINSCFFISFLFCLHFINFLYLCQYFLILFFLNMF